MRLYVGAGAARFRCPGGHLEWLFVWAPGCVHIDDHEQHAPPVCPEACGELELIGGDDPRAASVEP
jgi:hypothetical protein